MLSRCYLVIKDVICYNITMNTKYTYTYGYDVTKETYPQRVERAKKDKRIARMVMQLLATVRLPKHEEET